MYKRQELGKWGEDEATLYLENEGYVVIDRDWKAGKRDLDSLAVSPDGKTLVVVEVDVYKRQGLVFIYTTPYEVGNPRLDSLPRLPYTHAYSSAQPFVRFKEQLLHICKMIVPHPSSYVFL